MMGKPFKSIDDRERALVSAALMKPLSGYLAGKPRGGHYVCRLEDEWAATFHVKHAIACNSATSGLLAAAFAVGLKSDDKFACSAMTMSATAAAPMFTGASPVFIDVHDDDFGMYPYFGSAGAIRAFFVTNLFGHPAKLHELKKYCDERGLFLIEDNAQSPFAWEAGRMAGTIGHIGVFSLNVHKPLQCGEGGIIVTNDDGLAEKMRGFINHGENVGGIGLNLRMPELCAAVACGQLWRHEEIIGSRVDQAEALLDAIGDIPGLRMPVVREGCTHVYYTVPMVTEPPDGKLDGVIDGGAQARDLFCSFLKSDGVPIVQGYVPPLYRLPAFAPYKRSCPMAESLHDRRLFYLENCQWTFNAAEIKKIGDSFKRAAEQAFG